MGTRSTFNALFLKIIDFPHWVDVDIACFKKNTKKIRKIKIYKKPEVEGPNLKT